MLMPISQFSDIVYTKSIKKWLEFSYFKIQHNSYFCKKKHQIVLNVLIASKSGKPLNFKLYMHESFYKHNFKCHERKLN